MPAPVKPRAQPTTPPAVSAPAGGAAQLRDLARERTPAEAALRPPSFADFTGQEKTIERLRVMVGAARRRGEALPHVLLSGPPGLGKTTLCFILGHELGRPVRVTAGPVLEKPGDLAGLLTGLEAGEILFIDEIHRIPRAVEEYLYTAMEDFRIDILIDQGPNARSVRLDLARFTLVGATTRQGLLTPPMRSRFTLHSRLDYYGPEDLLKIVQRTCALLGAPCEEAGAREIAARCRGTPRIANNLVSFVRDFAEERGDGRITRAAAAAALELLEIDARGLDEMDKRMLRTMAVHHDGGPVGISTLAVALGEEPDTLEEVHEPYLIQSGYLARTPQGRVLTPLGYEVLGLSPAGGVAPGQATLF